MLPVLSSQSFDINHGFTCSAFLVILARGISGAGELGVAVETFLVSHVPVTIIALDPISDVSWEFAVT